MKNWFVVPFILLFLQLAGQEKIIFNDKHTVLRDPGSFRSIEVRGPINVYYSEGREMHVAVSANSDAARDRIRTTLSDGTLIISLESGMVWDWNNQEYRVYITAPTLDRVKASGAADVIVVDVLHAHTLRIDFSGASDFSGKLDCESLDVRLSGASDMQPSGTIKKAVITCTGASSFKGTALRVTDAELSATGASDLHVAVGNSLSAKATGASSIVVKGTPRIYNQQSTGASKIKIQQ